MPLHMLFPLSTTLFHSYPSGVFLLRLLLLCARPWAGPWDTEMNQTQFLTSRISEEKRLTEEEAQARS